MKVPEPIHSGKVRDTYDIDGRTRLVVASDRVSTFDVVHPTLIPDKGRVLNHMTEFWLRDTPVGQVMPNHLITTDLSGLPAWAQQFQGRGMVVKTLDMVPLEAVARAHIAGSAWKQYQKDGTMNGVLMPEGMVESEKLAPFVFTPSTKATVGHDENISVEQAADLVGEELTNRIEELTLAIFYRAYRFAWSRGIILADTKFEFGFDPETGELVLADEVLTPDSSRFWPADGFEPGHEQPSLDKQYIRDWATSTGWDKNPPAPEIPDDIVAGTRSRYHEISLLLTDSSPLEL